MLQISHPGATQEFRLAPEPPLAKPQAASPPTLTPPAVAAPAAAYVPPAALLMKGLGITERDLSKDTVSVSTAFLRFIISELVSRGRFDPRWYSERYPDVEGARLAGEVTSLHGHYCTQGYFEGRTGTPELRKEADRWVEAARGKPPASRV